MCATLALAVMSAGCIYTTQRRAPIQRRGLTPLGKQERRAGRLTTFKLSNGAFVRASGLAAVGERLYVLAEREEAKIEKALRTALARVVELRMDKKTGWKVADIYPIMNLSPEVTLTSMIALQGGFLFGGKTGRSAGIYEGVIDHGAIRLTRVQALPAPASGGVGAEGLCATRRYTIAGGSEFPQTPGYLAFAPFGTSRWIYHRLPVDAAGRSLKITGMTCGDTRGGGVEVIALAATPQGPKVHRILVDPLHPKNRPLASQVIVDFSMLFKDLPWRASITDPSSDFQGIARVGDWLVMISYQRLTTSIMSKCSRQSNECARELEATHPGIPIVFTKPTLGLVRPLVY